MKRQFDLFRRVAASGILALASLFAWPALAQTQLIMAEEHGCAWCAEWNETIAPIYPKTAEGRAAPLRRMDIHDPDPEDLSFDRPVRFTPTFILVEDGVEIARIEGHPGEDFFWGLLKAMLDEAGISYTDKAES